MFNRLFIAVFLVASSVSLQGADEKLDGQCEIEQVTCGSLSGPFAKAGFCQYVQLAKVGDASPPVGIKIDVFVGVRIDGKIAVIGGGEFEKGMRIECKVGVDRKTNEPDLEKLQMALTKLLAKNPEFRKNFPGVDKIVVDPTMLLSKSTATDVSKGFKASK